MYRDRQREKDERRSQRYLGQLDALCAAFASSPAFTFRVGQRIASPFPNEALIRKRLRRVSHVLPRPRIPVLVEQFATFTTRMASPPELISRVGSSAEAIEITEKAGKCLAMALGCPCACWATRSPLSGLHHAERAFMHASRRSRSRKRWGRRY